MLRDDGFVMDDGTVARLGPNRFLVTTTTAAAGEVMAHLDFAAQCLWPELDVAATSITDQWAQIAVAGPASRDLLAGIVDMPVDDASLPFMACAPAHVGGVRARVFRISFSGERVLRDRRARAVSARRCSSGWPRPRARSGAAPMGSRR